jgi:hypothetical protein
MDYLQHRSEYMTIAEIVNETEHELEMQVGNNVHFVNFGHLGRGATHTVPVDYTDTYQEYKFTTRQQQGSSRSLVVTSDDCCDYKRITIMEMDGQLTVQREPRQLAAPPAPAPAPVVPYRACGSHVGALSWKRWIRLRVF